MALFGLLNVHKPAGVTSRRIVDRIAALAKPAKVGHAGTLDPLATGVLIVGIGQATRLVEYVQQMRKRYRATFLLGCTSDTEDIEGKVIPLEGAAVPTLAELESAAQALTGEIQQRPPAFSALKVEGRRAYARARAGEAVELAPRPVQVYRLEVVEYIYPELQLDLECGSGTYVRSLGRDLAERVGTGAVMSALVRTAIGPFTLDRAVDPAALTRDNLAESLLPPLVAVEGLMPTCVVDADAARRLANGLAIEVAGQSTDPCAALDPRGRMVAILARRGDGSFGPAKYFPE